MASRLGTMVAEPLAMIDEALPLPSPRNELAEESGNVFEIGDRTVGLMRDQAFAFDEFGTCVSPAATAEIEIAAEETPADDTLHRVERKIDHAMRAITALQRRIASIDLVLARVVNRVPKT
jgi:hypothetical protein